MSEWFGHLPQTFRQTEFRRDDLTTNPDVAYVKIPTHCRFWRAHTSLFTSTHAWLSRPYLIHFSQLADGLLSFYHVHINTFGGERFAAASQRVWNYLPGRISANKQFKQLKHFCSGWPQRIVTVCNWEILLRTYLLTYLRTYWSLKCLCLPRRRKLASVAPHHFQETFWSLKVLNNTIAFNRWPFIAIHCVTNCRWAESIIIFDQWKQAAEF